MELAAGKARCSLSRCFGPSSSLNSRPRSAYLSSLWILLFPPSNYRWHPLTCHGQKKDSCARSVLKKVAFKEQEKVEVAEEEALEEIIEETSEEEDVEGFGDDMLINDNTEFEDEFLDEDEDVDPQFGDGSGGGGISLAGTWWDKEALSIAEEVSLLFNGDLKIFAFKTLVNSSIRLRIEKMSNKYGSPTMDDIEAFSSAYRLRLDEAEHVGTIPVNISLEVSSPGVERVVRVPEDFERFKDKPMYVIYTTMDADARAIQEADGVFNLISFDLEAFHCTWGIADVKINRQKAGKGRPLSKKQRQWRLQTPFDSLRLVRVHSDS